MGNCKPQASPMARPTPPLSPDARLLTAKELAAFLRIHPKTVHRYRRRYDLPCYQLGGQSRFDLAQVSRWLQERKGA